MEEEVRREIILANYQNPYNKEIPKAIKYQKINSRNISCIDNIDLYVDIENNIIKDIKFGGEACAITTSSTSIMIQNLINKTITEALIYIKNFENMINEKAYDKNILKDAIVFDEIYKQQNRKSCAFLPYRELKKYLESLESELK